MTPSKERDMIKLIAEDKKRYLDLLLLADEQEDMIDKYLAGGDMYVLFSDNTAVAVCVVTDEGDGVLEIKNIAVSPEYQNRGIGRYMIDFIADRYKKDFNILQAGTGESPATLPFYEKCGFLPSHRVENFFADNYDHPIIECGVILKDMIYLRKRIR